MNTFRLLSHEISGRLDELFTWLGVMRQSLANSKANPNAEARERWLAEDIIAHMEAREEELHRQFTAIRRKAAEEEI